MRRVALIALCLLAAGGVRAASPASAGLAVIVARDASVAGWDAAFLRDVFLRRVAIDAAGRRLVPVNLAPDDPLRLAFSEAVLDRTPGELQSYWNRRYFQGVSPPHVLASQEAVLRFVAATPGAVGYVAECRVDTRVRVVMHVPATPELAARRADLCGAD